MRTARCNHAPKEMPNQFTAIAVRMCQALKTWGQGDLIERHRFIGTQLYGLVRAIELWTRFGLHFKGSSQMNVTDLSLTMRSESSVAGTKKGERDRERGEETSMMSLMMQWWITSDLNAGRFRRRVQVLRCVLDASVQISGIASSVVYTDSKAVIVIIPMHPSSLISSNRIELRLTDYVFRSTIGGIDYL
ncbi:hypothetical protein PROFUN_03759 [Planoprotostelium fungivorum]|uniref:Uncharacterized protein n=1 Tax=Planoprotostelium fungivorum TaxID=1890364 RepID=A0A2P6NDN6_9EUKA|nr:hypothetical protein PROFUN_03759 [Planoprotostelium fungivorum]